MKYVESDACSPGKRRGKPLRSLTQLNNDIAECADRRRLAARIGRLIKTWEPILGVHTREWRIREMKTYWASVNEAEGKITFSLRLLEMPRAFVETTVVHELVHLLTNGHDAKFYALMDRHVPGWRKLHDQFSEELTQHS